MYGLDELTSAGNVATVYPELRDDNRIITVVLDDQYIAGYAMIEDVFGNPSIVVEVTVYREIYRQGQIGVFHMILAIVAVGLIVGALTIFFTDKQNLGRLSKLSTTFSG